MRSADQLVLRPPTDDEFPAFARQVELGFGEDVTDARIARWRTLTELDRMIAALDGERIVGTAGAWTFTMSLPDADPVPCAAVTVVGVAPDWRRRGVLTRMMRQQLDDVRDRGAEPYAALYASESTIYGRFGYGIAAPNASFELERAWTALHRAGPVDDVVLVDASTARDRFPAIHDAHRRQRGGLMGRPEAWWEDWLGHDEADERDGYSPRFHALLDDRGYAVYRVKPDWGPTGARSTLRVIELVANDPDALAALYGFVFAVDLVATIVVPQRPVDDPLPYLSAYRGRIKERRSEGLWLRLVDVGAALTARGYHADGQLTIEVADAFCPWNAGTWELEVADGSAGCRRADRAPDLALDTADLASISLGGVTATELAWAGRIEERTPGALRTADRLFATDLAPWNSFEF